MIHRNLSLMLAFLGILTTTTTLKAETTRKCFQPVRADMYVVVTVPAGTYKTRIANDAVYSYLKGLGTADNSAQISQYRTLLGQVDSLPLSTRLKNELKDFYRTEISTLTRKERRAATRACIAAILPQRLAALSSVPTPHVFQWLGNTWLGEDFDDANHKHYGDCNGVKGGWAICRKASDLK